MSPCLFCRVALGGSGFWCGWSSSVSSTTETRPCSGMGELCLVVGDFLLSEVSVFVGVEFFLAFFLLSLVEFLCFRFPVNEGVVVTDDAVVSDASVFTFVIGVICV